MRAAHGVSLPHSGGSGRIDLSSLRASYVAGEPLNPEVYKRWYELTGIKLREGFGQTETPVAIFTTPWMEPKPGSMGRPTPGFGIELLDENGVPAKTASRAKSA